MFGMIDMRFDRKFFFTRDRQVRQDKARVLGMHTSQDLSSCKFASNVLYHLYPDDFADMGHLVHSHIRYFDCRTKIVEETIS